MTTFLLRWNPPGGEGPTLAVKDLIDVAGVPTTCASRPVAEAAGPADADAACVATARVNGARLVGKTNLHELAFGGSGVNPWTGTPVNPLDATRIPGGSSSGSAVAVATGAAEIALGTDTGGSVRTPSACCGTVGLKTTYGRIPLDGVQPLAPSLDTVGPMAATVAGVVRGMAMLETGFAPAAEPAQEVGRFRLRGADPAIEDAIDRALAMAELGVTPCELPGWDAADSAGSTIVFVEAHEVHCRLLADHGDRLGSETVERLRRGGAIPRADLVAARSVATSWRGELDAALARTPVLALAGILDEPPPLDDPLRLDTRRPNVAVNLGGHPAIVLPVPGHLVEPGRLATSVQLVAAHGGEELLVATAALIEAAVAR